MHDSLGLEPLVRGIPPIRSRRGPRRQRRAKLHADKGYDCDYLCRWLRKSGNGHRTDREGIESLRTRCRIDRGVCWFEQGSESGDAPAVWA